MAKSIVNITRYFMIAIGLWKIPLTEDVFLQNCYVVYSLFVQCTFTLLNLSVIMRLLELINRDADPEKIFSSLTFSIIITIMNYNVIIFLKNGIPYLFSEIMEEEIKSLNSTDDEIRSSYSVQTKYYKYTTICQILSTVASAVMIIALNFYKKITNSFLENEGFMYDMWFPFDKTKYDSLVVLTNMLMVSFGSTYNIASRITPQTLIIFSNAQLINLQINIRKVFSNEEVDEKILLFKVKGLIRKHQSLIRFVATLNTAIKNVIFMEYVLNSVNVAAALLRFITGKTLIEMAFSFVYITLLIVQIFMQAWSANELNIQSANIANAVYESNWIDQNEEIKKLMHIMLMRAQKPLAIMIGPFRPINNEAALITMKGAYTYASVMIQQYT